MEELEKLIQKAEARTGKQIRMYRGYKQEYGLVVKGGPSTGDCFDVTLEQAIARLKELATPKDITVTIPYDKATEFAAEPWSPVGNAEPIADIIRKELKRVETE